MEEAELGLCESLRGLEGLGAFTTSLGSTCHLHLTMLWD